MTKPKNGHPANPPERPTPFRVLFRNGVLKVLDAKDRPVEGIIACDIAMRPGVPPLMRMNLAAGAFEVESGAVFMLLDPRFSKMRPIKRVEFADGGDDFMAEEFMAAIQSAQNAAAAAQTPPADQTHQEPPNAAQDHSEHQAADGGNTGGGRGGDGTVGDVQAGGRNNDPSETAG